MGQLTTINRYFAGQQGRAIRLQIPFLTKRPNTKLMRPNTKPQNANISNPLASNICQIMSVDNTVEV